MGQAEEDTVRRCITTFLVGREDTCERNSLATYRAYLSHFARWVGQQAEVTLWARTTIRAYIVHRRGDSNATLRNRIRYLRLLCNWLENEDLLSDNPFRGRNRVLIPVKKRVRRQVYTQAEVVALLHATAPAQWKRGARASDRRQWTPDGPLEREDLQGRALVLLLIDSALRAAEVAALTCGQIRAAQLWVRSKGAHDDVAFVSTTTRAALLRLAGERADDQPLFRDWNNKPCTTRGIRGIVQRLARRAGVTLPPRPVHAFRHYAARQWVKAKLADLVIQQLMRHEDVSTTQLYTELEPDELAALHAEASPIADLIRRAGLVA